MLLGEVFGEEGCCFCWCWDGVLVVVDDDEEEELVNAFSSTEAL